MSCWWLACLVHKVLPIFISMLKVTQPVKKLLPQLPRHCHNFPFHKCLYIRHQIFCHVFLNKLLCPGQGLRRSAIEMLWQGNKQPSVEHKTKAMFNYTWNRVCTYWYKDYVILWCTSFLGGSGGMPLRKFWNLDAWKCYLHCFPDSIWALTTIKINYVYYNHSLPQNLNHWLLEKSEGVWGNVPPENFEI